VYILLSVISECYSTTIRATARKVTALYDSALSATGVTIAQLALLRRLDEDVPLSVDELARSSDLERSTVARNVKVLEKQGLVELGKSTIDRRAAAILLTPEGADRRRACEPLWDAAQLEFEQRFGTERAETLRELCRQFEQVYSAAA
jgi:DNA-binding MarR family transcriptional regulator